jgi:hypothetical protein
MPCGKKGSFFQLRCSCLPDAISFLYPTSRWRLRSSGCPSRSGQPAAVRLDAYRNLLERAYGVAIRAKSTVRDFILKDDTIRSRVEAYIRGAKVIDTVYKDDGGVEVEMEVTLGYEFRQIFR